ncbi:hypothetical protein C2I18_15650 [Paenibacillus sp. PK3_47]|uniref:hypothetical protein n=1 Tax=Paenibacillus sp. PK3_47 TaxID=2072642 RepID=UPI00201DA506|nr:hypothetical protein [Paenibacillus sp. PK3_47]UQZ34837.1 hypothetical protein C2I18_15650 [Paenibacillus sp. PK3_47]
MLDERIKQGIYGLSKGTSINDIVTTWLMMGDTTEDKVSIISLDNYHRSAYPMDLKDLINTTDSHFISYFETDKLYFIDNDLLHETYMNGEKDTIFRLDYSIMLDTNYASYIHKFINFDWSTLNNEVFSSIDLLIRNNFNYDHIFYMIENYKNSFVNIEGESAEAIKDKKTKLYQNLVSLELFKSINREKYISTGRLHYDITENEAQLLADQTFNGIYNSAHATEMLDYYFSIQRQMVLLIIGIMQIKFGPKITVQKKLQRLFEYCTNVVGTYFDREMVIAHKYFSSQNDVKILNKINKGIRAEKILHLIENIAWDFSVPRIMERQLILGGQGRYFIPFFLSNDQNLRELLRLFKVKGIIYSKSNYFFIPFNGTNSQMYFEAHKFKIEPYFTEEALLRRAEIKAYNQDNLPQVINREFEKLLSILCI